MPIEKAYVRLREGQIHYRRQDGDGVPVLFLHQTASSGRMWEAVMAHLPGRSLIAIDTPGFGGSFDPATPPGMSEYAGWMFSALDVLGLSQVHVVGHHTGAAIGLQMASESPERITSLGMIGPNPLTPEERSSMAKRFGRPFKPGRSGAYLLQNWEYLRAGGADASIDLLHAEMVDMLRAWSARPHAYQAVWQQDFANLFGQLRVPALILSAPDDILFPYFERAKELRPDIHAALLPGGANFQPDIVPKEIVMQLTKFWETII